MDETCVSFSKCSAPLCPLDLKNDRWYPDEEICRKQKMNDTFIKQQKKIKDKVKPENIDKYYTLEMLSIKCGIYVGTKGIDPDRLEEDQEQNIITWMEKKKNKTPMSVKSKEYFVNKQNQSRDSL